MSEAQSNNRKIAKNSIFLNIRMIIVMCITLYTSRIVLQVLGSSDFGLYNVVGGFVSALAFFQSSLTNATQRYLNIAIAKGGLDKARKILSQSFWLYSLFAIILLAVSELFGVWFVNHLMAIPPDRLFAANVVFQLSVATVIVTILTIVYSADIVAREEMSVYAYVSIFDVIFKLGATSLLLFADGFDKLILYSVLMFTSSLISFFIYKIYCNKNFYESRVILLWNKSIVSDLLKFIFQNIYGCICWIVGSQGINILLNIFFGTVVNASRAIAYQVNNALIRFTDTVLAAMRPQITKSYALGDYSRMNNLVIMGTKINYTLFAVLAYPIYFNVDFILQLWLTEVPSGTSSFIKLLLVDSLINTLAAPLVTVSMASGLIKRSQVWGKTFILLVLPISYVLFKFNICIVPEIVFTLTIVADVLYFIYMLYDVRKQICFDVKSHLFNIILPIILITSFAYVLISLVTKLHFKGFVNFCLISILSELVLIVLLYLFLLSTEEKEYLQKILIKR